MEALTNAEKNAEQIIKGIQTVTDQNILQLEKDTVVKQQIISVRSEKSSELTESLKQAENRASQRLLDYNKVEKNRDSLSEINKLSESNSSRIPEAQENVEEVHLKDQDVNSQDKSAKETIFGSTNLDFLVSDTGTEVSGFSFGATLKSKSKLIENTASSVCTPATPAFEITDFNSKNGITKGITNSGNYDSTVSLPVTSNFDSSFGAPVQSKSSLVGNTNTCSSVFALGTSTSAITDINAKDGSSKKITDSGNCDSLFSVPVTSSSGFSFAATLQRKPSLIGNTTPSSSIFLSASSITDIDSKDGCTKETTDNVNRDSLVSVPVTSRFCFNFCAPVKSKSSLVENTKLYPRRILTSKKKYLSSKISAPSTTSTPFNFQSNTFGNRLESSLLRNFSFGSVTQSNLNNSGITNHDSSLSSSVASTSNLTCSLPAITGTTTPTGTTVKFNPTTGTDTMRTGEVSRSIGTRFQCITCMKEYENKSLEELREEDFAAGRHGKSAKGIAFGEITQTNFAAVKKIQEDFMNLLVSEEDSDITIKVQGKEIRAHKAILCARSPVFKSMFSHKMNENETGSVTIDDIDISTFQDFLRFIYTGSIEYITQKNVCGLYKASDKYDIQELKKACLMFMEKELSVDLFCDVMSLALLHNEKNLKELAIKFFCMNALEIIETPSWMSFLGSNSIAGNELFIKALSEPCQYCNQINLRKRGATQTGWLFSRS